MDPITRDVRDLPEGERYLIGHDLQEKQRIIVHVIKVYTHESDETRPEGSAGEPPCWKVYEGLSDEEVDRLDEAVRLRASFTRTFV